MRRRTPRTNHGPVRGPGSTSRHEAVAGQQLVTSAPASDVVVWARVIQQGPNSFLVVVSSAAAHEGDEDSATDLRTAEARTKIEAESMRDALVGQTVEAIESRGHNVVRVHRAESRAQL